ncbi:hypothetical protein C7S16_6459 [Burkholderia thailandensis]|uniref:Uncharacterized protein n=1 Tax=Burkholderia thailandensis TaxID=57975 RepID=A0AAW9CZK9_BURTH|nr:hypothetical protein [Burkholderia thailandensis]
MCGGKPAHRIAGGNRRAATRLRSETSCRDAGSDHAIESAGLKHRSQAPNQNAEPKHRTQAPNPNAEPQDHSQTERTESPPRQAVSRGTNPATIRPASRSIRPHAPRAK